MSSNLFKRTGGDDFSSHLKVMVSGPPKSGKTSLLGTVPGILVLDTEPHANNLESIAHLDVPYVTITNTDDLKQVAFMLRDETLRKQIANQVGVPDIKAVAIDTLDSLQKIMKAERMKEQRTTQFLRDDWGWLKTEMEEIVQTFTSLPMHVFFMVHTKTQEMGKGDDSYTVTLPGLEGSIAQSIAGMVGYSLLSFRKEEIDPTGKVYTKYWLRTEGDATHDFLGTRTAGRLPTVIEPNMATIWQAVQAGRPKRPAPQEQNLPPVQTTGESSETDTPGDDLPEEVAQSSVQPEPTEEPPAEVPANEPANEPEPSPAAESEQPSEPRPEADAPINAAAMTHVKRVYDSIEVPFPEEKIRNITMGQAREIVKYWRAVQQDAAEGKGTEDGPVKEMIGILDSYGYLPDTDTPVEPKATEPEPKIDGNIEQVLAYVHDDGTPNLAKVQEAYDFETAKDSPRKGLVNRLESMGAQTQTPVETPAEPEVTSQEPESDAGVTEEDKAQEVIEQGLGPVEVVEESVNPDGLCAVCNKPIDDIDLAELGKKRFNKLLCVSDYLAEIRK